MDVRHVSVNLDDYLLDQEGQHWSELLTDWHFLLPREFTIWLVNRFGDLFIVSDDGCVHMLDVGRGSLEKLASSREDFATQIDEGNNANQWLMIPLVDDCVRVGLTIGTGQCYSFKIPPVLGGEYSVSNTEVCDLSVHYSVLGQIHSQIKDLPDGTRVNIRLDKGEGRA